MSKSIYNDLLVEYRNTIIPTKQQIKEGMSITVDEEDAEQLLHLLAMAGIKSSTTPSTAIITTDEQLEEEKPDSQEPNWPTKPETFQDTPTLSSYSGGLNKPKTTGQSTTPILASQKNRQHTYENVDLERSLFKLYQDYKGE